MSEHGIERASRTHIEGAARVRGAGRGMIGRSMRARTGLTHLGRAARRFARSSANFVRREEDGMAAVEFAFIVVPFFTIIFAILETAVGFFAERALQNGTTDAARQLRLGNPQALGSPDSFRTVMCQNTGVATLFDCSRMKIDLRQVAAWDKPTPPQKPDGSFDEGQLSFTPGNKESINVLRVYYEWPRIFPAGNVFGGTSNALYLVNGNLMLTGAAAFVMEP